MSAYSFPITACRLQPTKAQLPFLNMRASCGFPSPAEDFLGEEQDLNDLCIRNPPATFFAQAEGDSMRAFGIEAGDMLVIDRSIEAKDGDICLVLFDGGFVVKKLRMGRNSIALLSGHPSHLPIVLGEEEELQVWGVITWSFKKHFRR